MKIFPAIDIRGGKVVRLTRGDFDKMEVYSADPAETARGFKALGAEYMHIVDLDGAKSGSPANTEAIKKIAGAGGMFIQTGGGIRDEDRIRAYLDIGVDRVILGTIIADDFNFALRMIAKYGGKVAAGIDALDGMFAVRGWQDKTSTDAMELCEALSKNGVSAIIYTDISRDGVMEGSNLGAYRALRDRVSCEIIASGGISSLSELVTLNDIGVDGAILGKSIYTGAIKLEEAIKYVD